MSDDALHKISQEDLCSQKATEEDEPDGEECDREAISCSVLCSLGASTASSTDHPMMQHQEEQRETSCMFGGDEEDDSEANCDLISSNNKCGSRKLPTASGGNQFCPKQLQLPMFLSKTFHMIEKCDNEIATWSDAGDNFVVKNVEKFASIVLPLYFKHSNFSSFARQLNFYGFRKLRSEAILTSENDPGSACFVRFYHENFQRDKPDLLAQIKRATKGDQQSKDDVESLRIKIYDLKDTLRSTVCDYDRRLSELSHEWNHRFSVLKGEQEKLVALIQRVLEPHGVTHPPALYSSMVPSESHLRPMASTVASIPSSVFQSRTQESSSVSDLLRSLSQAAVSLDVENEQVKQALMGNAKRPAPEIGGCKKKPSSKSK